MAMVLGQLSQPVVFAAAFIFGTQERRFFNFLYEWHRWWFKFLSIQSRQSAYIRHPTFGRQFRAALS